MLHARFTYRLAAVIIAFPFRLTLSSNTNNLELTHSPHVLPNG
ncbi:hypothetical protein J2Y86_003439 [Pseudomonas migulae]|nr:hypothetical protein [Pseudomonas migulae]